MKERESEPNMGINNSRNISIGNLKINKDPNFYEFDSKGNLL